jgi:KaiC/GvpD/RAD55 family RecA-like ATPase
MSEKQAVKTCAEQKLLEAKHLLANMYADRLCFVEFRFIREGQVIQRFHNTFYGIDWDDIQKHNDQGYNIYFAPCPRKEESGGKDSVCSISVLWADLDAKDFNGSKEKALKSLELPPDSLQPSVVVDTGHGYHLYWLLHEEVWLKNDDDVSRMEGYLSGLASHLHGDKVFDIGRLLRLPGTVNWKDPSNPVKCTVLSSRSYPGHFYDVYEFEAPRYVRFSLSEFDEFWAKPPSSGRVAVTFSENLPDIDISSIPISHKIKEIIEKGTSAEYKSRSERDMAVVDALVALRLSDDEIRAVFMKYPIGDKFRKQGDKYLAHTISKARCYIDANVNTEYEMKLPVDRRNNMQSQKSSFRVNWRDLDKYVGVAGDDIVEGLLPSGSNGKLFVAGERKIGKTTFGLTLGLAIAQGKSAFGRRQTKKSRVVFIDLEQTAQSVQDVMKKQAQALGEPDEGYFDVIGGQSFRVTDPTSITELWDLLREEPTPEVVIFDSIYALVDDINDSVQAQNVLDLLTKVINELGAAVVVLHHVSDPSDLMATQKPLGYLGRQLDRWCGVSLKYLQAGKQSLYRNLKGIRRGGHGEVNIFLQYIEAFQIVVELDWDEIPGTKQEKQKLLGEHPRVLMVKEVCGMAKLLKVTQLELAQRWGISDRQIRNYLDDGDVPRDEVFEKVVETRTEFIQRITNSK